MISNLIGRPLMYGMPTVSGAAAYNPQYPPNSTFTHYTHSRKRGRDYEKGQGEGSVYKRTKIYRTNTRMPVRFATRLRYGRRLRRKSFRRYKKKKLTIPRLLVPPTKMIKLRFCDRALLTGTSGAIAANVIYTNNIVDPTGAVGAQQPYYYDQLKTLYRSAVVVGAKVNISFHNTSSTVPAVVGLYLIPWDNSTSISTYEHWREMSTSGKQRILTSDIDVCHLGLKCSVKKHFGVKDLVDNDIYETDLETDTAPSKLGQYNYWAQALDQTSTATVEAVITVEYIVLVKNPYQPARS